MQKGLPRIEGDDGSMLSCPFLNNFRLKSVDRTFHPNQPFIDLMEFIIQEGRFCLQFHII